MLVDLPLVEANFRAMGSDCRIICDLDTSALHHSVFRIEDLERRWSRFLPDSEISECNERAGEWVDVSTITALLVERMIEAERRTAGRFNPLLLHQLESLGYDESFPFREKQASAIPSTVTTTGLAVAGGSVRVPSGAGLDPGGLGKGVAADLVMADLLDAGSTWAVVSLGGDIRLGGTHLAVTGQWVEVEKLSDPDAPRERVHVVDGAVATSSTAKRRWTSLDGEELHHLLDPATGLPAHTNRRSATVHATTAWWADVVAKCVVIDPTVGLAELADWDARAIVCSTDGSLERLGLALAEPIVHQS